MKKLNKIAIWSKFKDYGDWCYQYRIPNINEFIDNFKYEFAHFTITKIKPNAIKPYQSIDYDVEVFWGKYKVGDGWNKTVMANLKSYLEAGYIRVKKVDERDNKQVINQNDQMKLFYYEASKGTKKKYIIVEAATQMDGWNRILGTILSPQIKAGKIKPISEDIRMTFINDVTLNDEEGYKLSTAGYELTKEAYQLLSDKDVIVDHSATLGWSALWPSKKIESILSQRGIIKEKKSFKDKWVNKIKPNLKLTSNLFYKITQPVYKLVKGKEIKVKDKVIRVELLPIVPTHTTIVDTKSKYPSRRDPVTNRWKPVDKPTLHQPDKSPNALVCIATKDRREFKRVSRKDASEIISTQLADEKEWEYISKKEFRKLSKPKIGKAFTPHNMDKKYKRIPVEVEYVEQEMIRNSYRDKKTGKMVYLPITYKDTDRTFTKWEYQLYYDEQADNEYHYYKTSTPNSSSSKVAKIKRKKKHPNCLQGIKQPKGFSTYEVSFLKDWKEGSAEYVYQVTAKTEKKAIIRGTNRLHRECSHHEYHRKHGMPNLPLFKPVVKLLSESDSNTPVEKKSLVVRLKMPHVYNLPERKDKKGNIIPWTKKVTQLTTEKEKAEGGGIFKLIDQEIKTYTKYEVSYNRLDQSPFKKEPKKWKCPMKKKKNINK